MREKLGATLAAKLANGDWSVVEGSIIDPEHLAYYTARGDMLSILGPDGNGIAQMDCRKMRRFATIDTAGTSAQKAQEDRGRNHSWSVCGVWDFWPASKTLFLRHVWRKRVEWSELKADIAVVLKAWNVPLVLIESAHHGQPLASELSKITAVRLQSPVIKGMKLARVPTEGAKHERAIGSGMLNMLENGQLRLPDVQTVAGVSRWMPELESELLSWTGRPDETSDQIDMCSYAADHVKVNAVQWGGMVRA